MRIRTGEKAPAMHLDVLKSRIDGTWVGEIRIFWTGWTDILTIHDATQQEALDHGCRIMRRLAGER